MLVTAVLESFGLLVNERMLLADHTRRWKLDRECFKSRSSWCRLGGSRLAAAKDDGASELRANSVMRNLPKENL
jgi:hypothetical protein